MSKLLFRIALTCLGFFLVSSSATAAAGKITMFEVTAAHKPNTADQDKIEYAFNATFSASGNSVALSLNWWSPSNSVSSLGDISANADIPVTGGYQAIGSGVQYTVHRPIPQYYEGVLAFYAGTPLQYSVLDTRRKSTPVPFL